MSTPLISLIYLFMIPYLLESKAILDFITMTAINSVSITIFVKEESH